MTPSDRCRDVAICESVRDTSVRLTTVGPKDENGFEDVTHTFYLIEGNMRFRKGDEFKSGGGVPGGAVKVQSQPALVPGQWIVLHVGKDDLRSYFEIPKRGLPTSGWLKSDGSTSPTPCTGKYFGS
jgi:hypothetical protein